MYKTTKERNLGIRTSGDWRQPVPSPTRSPNTRTPGEGKSVAALQQQWRTQMQEPPVKRTSPRYPVPKRISEDIKSQAIYDNLDEAHEKINEPMDEDRMTVTQRSRSPSINLGSSGSIHSQTSIPYQEFRVVKEGWMYRKNGLMQWKPVYVVAKHGNSVRPGGLYMYKDVKCTNHVQTYDMSEVLEVSPRAQEYKQGIKWEIRMLVKRDDVILGTDDMISRKDWVDSLTSIMGKVSIATQNELTSRIQSSEQMNRSLQNVAEELDDENRQLRDQFEGLKDVLSKRDHKFQQELNSREAELKMALEKQENLFHMDLQAREHELQEELDRTQSMLEKKCARFEREAKEWRTRYTDLESKSHLDKDSQAKINALETQVLKWRNRVDELEKNQMEYKKIAKPDDTDRETLSDIKFNIQILRDQLKQASPPDLGEIKRTLQSLSESLQDTKTSWKDLECDILKFLEAERQDADSKKSSQKHGLSLISQDLNHLREELVGISNHDSHDEKRIPSLTEKFDILLEIVENIHIGQSRLSLSVAEKESPLEGSKVWMQEIRKLVKSPGSTDSTAYEEFLARMDKTMSELIKNQEETQEEQTKSIKAIASYLQLMTNDIQNSTIPDLPALSQQLEDVVERLAATENRLSMVNTTPTWTPSQELKNMPVKDSTGTDEKDLVPLYCLVKNTEQFISQALTAINRQEGSNGMEEIVRRAVKSASKHQIEQVISLQEQHAEDRKSMDSKMQGYEENARGYFDRSMKKMHSDLHEFTGVMYEMLERLVLQALEHGSAAPAGSNGEMADQRPIQSIVDLHAKLSSLNQVLKVEIERLEKEKQELETSVNKMRQECKDLEKQVDKRQDELRSVQAEYEQTSIAQSKSAAHISKELEPLMDQIMKLKQMASVSSQNDDITYMDHDAKPSSAKSPIPNRNSRYEEEPERDMRFSFPRRESFSSQFSENNRDLRQQRYEPSTIKSPLVGVRDRPRGKSPLASFLSRK